MTRISALTALASADAGDTLPILDVSATTTKKITKTAYLSDVIDGTLLGDNSIQSRHIDWADTGAGDNGGIWWEEIGRTTLGSAGDTISVTPIAARKYLRIFVALLPTGGTINGGLQFNNDTGTNYATKRITDGTAASTTSSAVISIDPDVTATVKWGVFDVLNILAQEKQVVGSMHSAGAAGAGNVPISRTSFAKWANTAAQITRVDVLNGGAGDFAIGSEIVVLGHD